MSEELTIGVAESSDLRYLMSLMRANRESVGGLPAPAIQERIDRGTVLLERLNGDPCGYFAYDIHGGLIRGVQTCIQYDARRRKYGEALIAALLAKHNQADEIVLRCAADLEANLFWRELGFTCIRRSAGGRRRGRTINTWAMWLTPRLFTVEDIAVVPAAELRQDLMYDDTEFLRAAPDGFAPAVQLPKLAWANRKPIP